MKFNNLKDYKISFYLTLLISLWLSIGINPEVIEIFFINLNETNLTIQNVIKFLRIFVPIILSIYLIFIFIKKINYNKKFFYSNFSILFLNFFLLIQLISLVISNNSLINIYWIYQSFVALILIYLITEEDFLYSKIIINLKIFILSIVVIVYSYPFIINFYSTHLSFYNMWPIIFDNNFAAPRPTGISRSCLIIMTFFLVFKFKNKKLLIINNSIIIICSLLIICFQSRTILFLWFLIIMIYLFFSNMSNKVKFKKAIIYIFLPLVLFLTLNLSKFIIVNFNQFTFHSMLSIIDQNEELANQKKDNALTPTQVFRDTDPRSFSSFRTLHWKNIFNDSKINFMGHGPMGDRYIINMSASSLFFYALASSGYIGLIIVIILSIRTMYIVAYLIFIKRIIYFNYDAYLSFSCFVLIILFLRGILETSFGIFSIDYLLFIISSLVCEINYSKYKYKDKFK